MDGSNYDKKNPFNDSFGRYPFKNDEPSSNLQHNSITNHMDHPNFQEKSNKQKFEEFMNDNVLPFQWDNTNLNSDDILISDDDDSYIYLSDEFSADSYNSHSISSYLDIPHRTRQNYSLSDCESLQSDDSYLWELTSDDTSDDLSYNSINYNQFNSHQSDFQYQEPNETLNHSYVNSYNNNINDISLGGTKSNHQLINHNHPIHIPPNILTDEPVYTKDNPYMLSIEQWKSINLQITRHFQLLVQVFLLSRKISPEDIKIRDELWCILEEFYKNFSSNNLFPVNGINQIKTLEPLTKSNEPLLDDDFNKEISKFSPFFSPKLRIELDRKTNKPPKKWTPAEDKLLAMGFDRYQKDWNAIQSMMLPTKEIKSIKSRFKNKTSKKSRDNPIKQVYLKSISPLSDYELMVLSNYVKLYGNNFDLIAKLMPPRKPFWLKRTWKKLNSNKRNTSKVKIRKRDEDDSYDEISDQSETDDLSSESENFKRKKIKCDNSS